MSLTRWALTQVREERGRQDEQWGEQNHPYLPPLLPVKKRLEYTGQATKWKILNERRAQRGQLAWDGILLEEVFEALAEENNDRRIEELTQVAAVAVAMIEAIRRGGTR